MVNKVMRYMMNKVILHVPKKIKNKLFLRISYWGVINSYYKFKSIKDYGYTDMFHSVAIETITQCNRRCSYCPNSVFERSLPKNKKVMEEEVFKKIIDDLVAINYKGSVVPNLYGEPLLDERLIDLLKYTREKLPEAKLVLISNGDFLTIPLYKNLVNAGVDEFVITQHSENMGKNMTLLFQYFGNDPQKIKQRILLKRYEDNSNRPISFLYRKLDVFYNRGGLVKLENVSDSTNLEANPLPICYYYSNPISLTYKGDVLLCCQDYHSTIVFGNIKDQSIKEIWDDSRFKKIRTQLRKRIYKLPICKLCVCQEQQGKKSI